MKLVIISRIIAEVVEMVSRRSCHSWICSPRRGTKTTRIHVSASRFKHLFTCKVAVTTSGFELHFKPVKKHGDYQNKGCALKVGNASFAHYLNGNTECTQKQQMTPRKFDYFLRSIQSILQFVNCINLHDNRVSWLIRYILPLISLKISKNNELTMNFLVSCCLTAIHLIALKL